MALSNFFKINLPYGIMKNEKGYWSAFNREYKPLGQNDSQRHFEESEYTFTNYGKLSDRFLVGLAHNEEAIERNESGEIIKVFFYNDSNNPSNTGKGSDWDKYFEKIERLGTKKSK